MIERCTWTATVLTILATSNGAPQLGQFVSSARADQVDRSGRASSSTTVILQWQNVPLRPALARLARTTGVGIFLDRRIDPAMRVSLAARNVTAESALAQLAESSSLAVTNLGNLLYAGPGETCAQLPTLIAAKRHEIDRLPRQRRQPFQKIGETTWPRLSMPRTIIMELIEGSGTKIANPEQIRHDLWPAGSLPALPLATRLSILLAGFDQTYAITDGGRSLEIVPLDEKMPLRASYQVLTEHSLDLPSIRRQLPAARVTINDGSLTMEGRLEDHQRLRQLLDEATRATADRRPERTKTKQVFTLRVQDQPLRPLLQQLAKQLGLELKWNTRDIARSGISLDQRVTFSVVNAELNELLEALLGSTGLSFQCDGQQLEIMPASTSSHPPSKQP